MPCCALYELCQRCVCMHQGHFKMGKPQMIWQSFFCWRQRTKTLGAEEILTDFLGHTPRQVYRWIIFIKKLFLGINFNCCDWNVFPTLSSVMSLEMTVSCSLPQQKHCHECSLVQTAVHTRVSNSLEDNYPAAFKREHRINTLSLLLFFWEVPNMHRSLGITDQLPALFKPDLKIKSVLLGQHLLSLISLFKHSGFCISFK